MLQYYKMSPSYASKAQDGPFEFRVYAMYTVQEKSLLVTWVVSEGKPYLIIHL